MTEIERKAAAAVKADNPGWCDTTYDKVAVSISRAGLLASETMVACAEAAVVYGKTYNSQANLLSKEGQRVAVAGRAHAATLAKVERYTRDDKTPGCCCIKDATSGKWLTAEEILARLNERAK